LLGCEDDCPWAQGRKAVCELTSHSTVVVARHNSRKLDPGVTTRTT